MTKSDGENKMKTRATVNKQYIDVSTSMKDLRNHQVHL